MVAIVDQMGHYDIGLTIPARSEIVLDVGAANIVLLGMKKPLRALDTIDFSCISSQAGKIRVSVIVKSSEHTAHQRDLPAQVVDHVR